MRLFRCCLLIALLQPVSIVAQSAAPIPQANPAKDLWLIRSQTITDDLIKDADDLSSSDRAILWAKLAQRWWRTNPEKARAWLQKAIEIVKAIPNRENPDERSMRLSAARSILQIITPLDQELSKQLVSLLTDDSTKVNHDADADGLIDAAIALVDKDPQRAAELGSLALRVGRPAQIESLLFPLRRKNPKLADALFADALATGRTLDSELLSSLAFAAFPAERKIAGPNVPVPPDDLRRQLLELDLAFLQAHPMSSENKNPVCASVVAFIAPVLSQFDRLLPEAAAVSRQSVNQCQSSSPLAREALSEQPLNTVDALLKAADDAQDVKVRTLYQYRAAEMAYNNKDYARALKILDSIDQDGRALMGESWEAYRWQWAALAALEHYKNGDVYGMRLVINAVPEDLQPLAKIAFVGQLPEKRNKETEPTVEFLNEARTGLGRSGISDAEKCTWYFGLLRLTVRYQPADATAVLRETVASLNRAVKTNEQDKGPDDRGSFLQSISSNLPAALMEIDEYAVKEAVSSIAVPEIRIQVRLDLLGACLARLRNLKAASQGISGSDRFQTFNLRPSA